MAITVKLRTWFCSVVSFGCPLKEILNTRRIRVARGVAYSALHDIQRLCRPSCTIQTGSDSLVAVR
jgi:hypothetical protein